MSELHGGGDSSGVFAGRNNGPSPPQNQNRNNNNNKTPDMLIPMMSLEQRREQLLFDVVADTPAQTNNVLRQEKADLKANEETAETNEKIKALLAEVENIKLENYKLKGEVSTLRRTNDKLKDEQRIDFQSRYKNAQLTKLHLSTF